MMSPRAQTTLLFPQVVTGVNYWLGRYIYVCVRACVWSAYLYEDPRKD